MEHLPNDCFIGSLFSTDIKAACESVESIRLHGLSFPHENNERLLLIKAVFGNTNAKLLKKFSTEKLQVLFDFFRKQIETEDGSYDFPNNRDGMWSLCQCNTWRLQSYLDTLLIAIDMSRKAFEARMPTLKRHLKTLLIECSTVYGGA